MNTQEPSRADLPRSRPEGDALDVDIQQSLDRQACVFGSKLETPHPWVIKRTRHTRPKLMHGRLIPAAVVTEYYTGMAPTPRNWSVQEPAWNLSIACAVAFADRDEAVNFIRQMDLKPRAEVVMREPVQNNGR